MKNIINKMKNRVCSLATTVQTTIESNKAEGYVDSGVKILIAVVIGALLLAGLYTLFNTNIIPTLSTKISGLFNYSGN
jgi:hypothetical protein